MAAMAMASFPFTNNFSGCCSPTLSPNSNGYIRADLSTDGATRACIIILTNDKEISLAINLLSNPNQLFGTGDRTEPASLASLSINFYLGHDSLPTALGLRLKVGGKINCLKPLTSTLKHQFEF